MSAYFVTATGTDIGKTFVTAGLVRYLRAQGKAVRALKPIISGIDDLAASDTGALLAALGEPVTRESVARLSPWRFKEPLSPDMAAAREGRVVPFDDLVTFCRSAIGDDTLFIEGVGGILVPLDDHNLVRDWVRALGLPLIVVAGSYLGTISHTLTALEAMAGLRIAALVLNESETSPVPLAETAATLARFAPGVPIVPVPRHARPQDFAPLARALI
ncbi:MAG TPA: dethiobiotin synthase [Rhizomicrobium sp.]|nr:dethiobiotin synthase [Rhizomicrobium sp.]